jgi:hypothetical protein
MIPLLWLGSDPLLWLGSDPLLWLGSDWCLLEEANYFGSKIFSFSAGPSGSGFGLVQCLRDHRLLLHVLHLRLARHVLHLRLALHVLDLLRYCRRWDDDALRRLDDVDRVGHC